MYSGLVCVILKMCLKLKNTNRRYEIYMYMRVKTFDGHVKRICYFCRLVYYLHYYIVCAFIRMYVILLNYKNILQFTNFYLIRYCTNIFLIIRNVRGFWWRTLLLLNHVQNANMYFWNKNTFWNIRTNNQSIIFIKLTS